MNKILLYLIKNYINNLNDSWNDIIDILNFLIHKIDKNSKNNIIEIVYEIAKLLLLGNLNCNIKKYIELCENINSDSIILNSIIGNMKISINNIDLFYSKIYI